MLPSRGPDQLPPPSVVAKTWTFVASVRSPKVAKPRAGDWKASRGGPDAAVAAIVASVHVAPPSCVTAMVIGMLSDARYAVSPSTRAVAAVVDQPGGLTSTQV